MVDTRINQNLKSESNYFKKINVYYGSETKLGKWNYSNRDFRRNNF